MPYRALGQLRQELQDRLGFGSAGSAGNINRRILVSFLRDAQWQLYWQAEWPSLTFNGDYTIPIGSSTVPYESAWNMDRLLWHGVNIGSSGSPQWVKLNEGIQLEHYNAFTTAGYPVRYERRATGFEILPARDRAYTGKVRYMAPLRAFEQDDDIATIDDGIVFLMALANAKAHYKHRDADIYASQLTAVLSRLKSTQWGNQRFMPADRLPPPPMPRPTVI
jgi:hypothetical protein